MKITDTVKIKNYS